MPMRKYKSMQMVSDYSSNLFNPPSFLKGIARTLDLYGNLDAYNYSDTEQEADSNALKKDWEIIGQDIWDALRKYESSISQ